MACYIGHLAAGAPADPGARNPKGPGLSLRRRDKGPVDQPAWCQLHRRTRLPNRRRPQLLLHRLSHLLITEMAWECAYGSSSIRERIYAYSEISCGILLLTDSSGSEGTLGGLVCPVSTT